MHYDVLLMETETIIQKASQEERRQMKEGTD
jgi:hypothetical protein